MGEYYVTKQNIEAKTAQWLTAVEPFNRRNLALNVQKSALLVIDMQNFFLDENSPTFTCGGLAILPNASSLIAAFRQLNLPVIFTRHVHNPNRSDLGIMGWWWQGACFENTPESEIHASIAPLKSEKQVFKHRYSAFYNTDLETVLRCMHVEDVVICGIMTNMCCESTARDAYFRDLRVFFLADATGSICEEMHVATLLNLAFGFARIATTGEILKELHA